jgi:cytoskeletal protein RodZ
MGADELKPMRRIRPIAWVIAVSMIVLLCLLMWWVFVVSVRYAVRTAKADSCIEQTVERGRSVGGERCDRTGFSRSTVKLAVYLSRRGIDGG